MPTSSPNTLLAGWAGSSNLGDELVLASLLGKLRARGVEPVVVSVDPAGTTRDHGVRAVRSRDLGAVAGADRVLFGGGGLVNDLTSPFNLPYHLSRLWIARAPFAGVGLGVGPLVTRAGRAMTRRTMASAVAISVRDEESARLLVEVGLDPPVLAADLALALPRPQVEGVDRLVVCLRPWSGGRSRLPVGARRRPTPEWFLDGMAAALDEAASTTGLAVHLVAFQPDRDDLVHREVAARMTTPATASTPGLGTVLDEVASARVVVAMRYHGGIAATLAGRPSVLVGYTPKVPSLAADIGPGSAGLRWDPSDVAAIPAAIERVLGRDEDVEAAYARLRDRERGSDRVIDRLLEETGAG